MDARQFVDPNVISELTICFGDPEVGAVSGELLLDASCESPSNALGIYLEVRESIA